MLKEPNRSLKDLGIGPEEARQIRALQESFAPLWDDPAMDDYDDIDLEKEYKEAEARTPPVRKRKRKR